MEPLVAILEAVDRAKQEGFSITTKHWGVMLHPWLSNEWVPIPQSNSCLCPLGSLLLWTSGSDEMSLREAAASKLGVDSGYIHDFIEAFDSGVAREGSVGAQDGLTVRRYVNLVQEPVRAKPRRRRRHRGKHK